MQYIFLTFKNHLFASLQK
uniref:Uncharacterized protein n=1 Tax=Arundo donax TaxID=35708 RepID=A0A0A9AH74_ARUDO